MCMKWMEMGSEDVSHGEWTKMIILTSHVSWGWEVGATNYCDLHVAPPPYLFIFVLAHPFLSFFSALTFPIHSFLDFSLTHIPHFYLGIITFIFHISFIYIWMLISIRMCINQSRVLVGNKDSPIYYS